MTRMSTQIISETERQDLERPIMVVADHVDVSYPIYEPERSFRRVIINSGVSRIKREGRGRPYVQSLKDLNFTLRRGDRLGLMGPNGAGKSTLLKLLAGAIMPSSGTLKVEGRISSLFTTGVGMDLDESGYDNIYGCCLLLGMAPEEIEQKKEEIVAFTDIGDQIYLPARTYSSGMLLRLSFAIATSVTPEILLIDEIIGAGDATFLDKASNRVKALASSASCLVLAAHSEAALKEYCNIGLFLLNGKAAGFGPIDEVCATYNEWVRSKTG
jgi:ABC-type polysaccharide/polyol phosphate transport system ATPase subunit